MNRFLLTILDDWFVSCKNGEALSTYGDFCQKGQECPIKKNLALFCQATVAKAQTIFVQYMDKLQKFVWIE